MEQWRGKTVMARRKARKPPTEADLVKDEFEDIMCAELPMDDWQVDAALRLKRKWQSEARDRTKKLCVAACAAKRRGHMAEHNQQYEFLTETTV